MRGDAMDIWNWIDYLTRGLKKVATESQQNYQQVHAYIDGHDKETLNQVNEIVYDSIKLKSPNGTVYEITIGDDGTINKKKVGEWKMELETKLPVPDRETRRVIESNFQKIQDEFNKMESQLKKQSDIYNAGGGM